MRHLVPKSAFAWSIQLNGSNEAVEKAGLDMSTRYYIIARGSSPRTPLLPAGIDLLTTKPDKPVRIWHGREGKDRAGAELALVQALLPQFRLWFEALEVGWMVPVMEQAVAQGNAPVDALVTAFKIHTGRIPEIVDG